MHPSNAPEQAAVSPSSRTSLLGANPAQRIAFTLAMLALYLLARLIPAAGINPDFSFATDGANPQLAYDLSPTLSYVALGVTPLFSVLLLAEVFKLAFSDVRSWAVESRRTRYLLNKALVVAALMLAAFQAYGLSVGLDALQTSYGAQETLPILEPGLQFRASYILGVVTGTALAIWVADQITRHGNGSGFWMLFLLPSLIALAMMPATWLVHLANGLLSAPALGALLIVMVASAAAITALTRQWIALAPSAAEFDQASDMARIMLWPPFIASSIAALLAALMTFVSGVDGGLWLLRGSLAWSISIAVLIPFLTYAMANGMLDLTTRNAPQTRRLLAMTVVAATATCVAIDVIATHVAPLAISGPIWIAMLTVFALLLPSNASAYLTKQAPAAELDDNNGTA